MTLDEMTNSLRIQAAAPADHRSSGERRADRGPDRAAAAAAKLIENASSANDRAYDYEVSEDHELIVKIVDRADRSKVIRQYPSESELKFRRAFRRYLDLVA